MKDPQKRLDEATDALGAILKNAMRGANEACAEGDNDTSSKLWNIAGHICFAIGEGRSIEIPSDGEKIMARAGDK